MLSTSSWNALLKTLEEPPTYAYFILATTEWHKIPATIISRCQRFEFKRISDDVLIQRVQELARLEGWKIDQEVVRLIVSRADGCVRDAETLLGQLGSLGPTLAIEDMVYLMDKGCDLISCTRYAHGGRRLGGSAVESIVSNVGNKLFRVLCGSVFSDSTTGFKMFRRDIFEKIKLESKPIGWAVVFELAVKAQAQGFKLGEVPIISIDRLYGGKSTFFLGPWFREYIKWFVYGMVHLHNGKKTKLRVRIPKVTAD
jgi:hypothetical protein